MNVSVVGCSHHSAPLAMREQLAFNPPQARDAMGMLLQRFPDTEFVLLSTCNRTELYSADLNRPPDNRQQEIVSLLARQRQLDPARLSEALESRHGIDAIRHLFRVTSSLDSMVLGEPQILAQVKQAYDLAAGLASSMPVLHTAFQHALKAAKRVTTETSIQKKRVSVPSVAISDFAQRIFERFDDKVGLMIGAGEMAEETLAYLRDLGIGRLFVLNRDAERGEALAAAWDARFRPWEELPEALTEADIVVSATGADRPIVDREMFRSIERRRAQRVLFMLDLAVPRDIAPGIGDCLGVYLFSIDDLQEVCEANRRERQNELPAAERIIEQEAQRFVDDWQMRASGITIQRLREMAEEIKRVELQRLHGKLDSLDDRYRDEIEKSFDRLVNKLLHPPLESLRHESHGSQHLNLVMALKRLFQLKD